MSTLASSLQRKALPVPTLLLMAAMLSTGASGLVTEYVLATVSTYVLGNSIEQFSVVIGIMFVTMGIASFMQRFVGDSYLVEKFLAVEIVLALLGGFAPLMIYSAYAVFDTHFPLVLYGVTASIGFLIGFEIPLIIRINERYVGELKANLGWILSMDYVGGFAGAIIWVKILLASFPLTEISFIVSIANFAVAILAFVYFTQIGAVRLQRLGYLMVTVTIACLMYGYAHNRSWSLSIEQQLYEDPIVHSETSQYQRIVLTHAKDTDDYRLYLNGNVQFSSLDEAIYHEFLVHPAFAIAPRHKRVLILGGGDGLALREVLKYKDVQEVLLVDIDPAMVRLASSNETLRSLNNEAFHDARVKKIATNAVSPDGFREVWQETGREHGGTPEKMRTATVSVLHVDAYKFLTEIGDGPWDIVIIDFPDPEAVELAKLYSREFFTFLGRALHNESIVVIQSTSPYHAKEVYLCIGRTMESAGLHTLPYHANVPSFGDWGWYIASPTQSKERLSAKLKGTNSLRIKASHITPDLMRASLTFSPAWLATDDERVNTLMDPVTFNLYRGTAWKIE